LKARELLLVGADVSLKGGEVRAGGVKMRV
jgi:hypothetical protein